LVQWIHLERLEEAETLLNLAVKYPNVREMLDSISLDSTVEKEKEVRVILSTIHQAKGLEWDKVFVISLANGLFPSNRASDIEEERRLFYVACSRAKNELYLCYPQSSGNKKCDCAPCAPAICGDGR
jgi:DNA helicase-2/ATP-dependent DNA helicase PcrA